jgi:hypothetical protein
MARFEKRIQKIETGAIPREPFYNAFENPDGSFSVSGDGRKVHLKDESELQGFIDENNLDEGDRLRMFIVSIDG